MILVKLHVHADDALAKLRYCSSVYRGVIISQVIAAEARSEIAFRNRIVVIA